MRYRVPTSARDANSPACAALLCPIPVLVASWSSISAPAASRNMESHGAVSEEYASMRPLDLSVICNPMTGIMWSPGDATTAKSAFVSTGAR